MRRNADDQTGVLTPVEAREALANQLAVLASPTRLALMDRLARPAFAPDLEEELKLARQTVKKHLDQLIEAGLVEARPAKRGVFPATEYVASAPGVFAFKENVLSLATPPAMATIHNTAPAFTTRDVHARPGAGLFVVHGRTLGEWFALDPTRACTIGRDEANDVALPWDPFASARHAIIERSPAGWTVLDLDAKNGTLVDLAAVPRGARVPLSPGSVLGIGKSLFVLRE